MRQAGEVTFADAHRPKLNEGWAGYFLSCYSPCWTVFAWIWIATVLLLCVILIFFYSVVEFASHSDLKNAVEKLSGKEINGRKIKLVEATRKKWVIVFSCLFMFKLYYFICIINAVNIICNTVNIYVMFKEMHIKKNNMFLLLCVTRKICAHIILLTSLGSVLFLKKLMLSKHEKSHWP